jgi:hypothetical protein
MAMQKQVNSSMKRPALELEGQSSKSQKTVRPYERSLSAEELFSLPKTLFKPPFPRRDRRDFHKKIEPQLLKGKEIQVSRM